VATLVAHREQLDRLAHTLATKETLNEDEAYTAAGVPRDGAPDTLARGDPRVWPEPRIPPPTDSPERPVAETPPMGQ
jgi:hypothetical protein